MPPAPPRISSTWMDALPPLALHASFPRSRLQIGGPHQVWRLLRHKMEWPHLCPFPPSITQENMSLGRRMMHLPSLSLHRFPSKTEFFGGLALPSILIEICRTNTSPARPLARSLHQRLGVCEREGGRVVGGARTRFVGRRGAVTDADGRLRERRDARKCGRLRSDS